MFCIPIIGPSLNQVKEQLTRAHSLADLIELRIDLFDDAVQTHLPSLRSMITKPLICTGGGEDLQPDYLDSEKGGDLVSYHNFDETPDDLEAILNKMPKGKLYKIATYANSTLDALRMILFARRHPNVLGMCMGEKGLITRVLGSPWRYVALSEKEKSAPGQPTIEEMKRYRVGGNLYGLIGKTVDQSPSHITHNQAIQKFGLNATYVKMAIDQSEIESFLKLARLIGFKGLSVTINLKEAIVPYLDHIETDCGAVNTIVVEKDKLIGLNTDGPGAFAALPTMPNHVVILGAGGAAKMISHTLIQKGIKVSILNRATIKELALLDYDVLINTIPVTIPVDLKPKTTVMDIRHGDTQLLDKAKKLGCCTVNGKKMFFHQAALQFSRWNIGQRLWSWSDLV